MVLKLVESHTCFGGSQRVYTHWSHATKCDMRFALYLPPAAQKEHVPAVYWLSGLTSSEQNFITKSGAQRIAAECGLAIIVPDTSPRGLVLPDTLEREYLGEGAGFYIDATEKPWCDHYQMYTYVSQELPALVTKHFPIDVTRCGIFGHSMGGHGALTVGLKNPHQYRSLSAFAPICSLASTPWGVQALRSYLGEHQQAWQPYDACRVVQTHGWPHGTILVDQGRDDPFADEQLKPEQWVAACAQANVSTQLRWHETYDHSYYFIATFMEDHLRFHAAQLNLSPSPSP